MIGDLLDPEGPHGQGQVFLRLFLDKVGFDYGGDLRNSRVDVELPLEDNGRLDVAVRIGDRCCLAIENKPFAGDGKDQITIYLDRLGREYGDKFLLIYLSPRGEAPSDYSVKLADLQDEADDPAATFRIMPYQRGEDGDDDEYEPFRTGFGLADWLRECRKHCDVERLRWFLREAETYCERQFGEGAMTTGESKVIKDFVLADGRRWETARAIERALPEIAAEVRWRFLEIIANRLTAAGYRSGWNDSDKAWSSWIRAYLPQWREYKMPESEWSRTCLSLEAGSRRGNGWYIGIRSPLPEDQTSTDDRLRRTRIEQRLHDESTSVGKKSKWWPWYEFVDERYYDWDALIPDLHRESQQGGGEIADYFVNKFVEIAKFARPVLDDIEGSHP